MAMEELAKQEEERGTPDSRNVKDRGGKTLRGKEALTLETGGGGNAGERVASNEMYTFLLRSK